MFVNQFEEPTYPSHDIKEEIGTDHDGLEALARAVYDANFEAAEYEKELLAMED